VEFVAEKGDDPFLGGALGLADVAHGLSTPPGLGARVNCG
jgi:hypothetical protein